MNSSSKFLHSKSFTENDTQLFNIPEISQQLNSCYLNFLKKFFFENEKLS